MACYLHNTVQLLSDVVEHYTSQAPPQQQPPLPQQREPEKLTAQKSPVTDSSKQTPSLKCPLCEKTFDKIFQLNLHLSRHQVNKLIQLLCDSNKNMRTELSPAGRDSHKEKVFLSHLYHIQVRTSICCSKILPKR